MAEPHEQPFPGEEIHPNDPRYQEAKRKRERKYNGAARVEPLVPMDYTIDPIPPREWVVQDRMPLRNVTLLSGEGSVGKSILAMQLCAVIAINAGRDIDIDWLGQLPIGGDVMYLTCEEDRDETAHRLEAIARHYHTSRAELLKHMHVYSRVGLFSLLAEVQREQLHATELWQLLCDLAHKVRPRIIVIDTAADVYGGNEINRQQTRAFITMLRGLAIDVSAGILLVAHPSLEGIRSGTGLSGSTAWHNSVRARAYFQNLSDDERDNDLRVLEWKKSNYGPVSERMVVRYKAGAYAIEPSTGSAEQLMADRAIEAVFLDLLRRFARQDRNVSDKPGHGYAPAIFETEPEARQATPPVRKKDLINAMARLFKAERIKIETIGPPSRPIRRLVELGGAAQT